MGFDPIAYVLSGNATEEQANLLNLQNADTNVRLKMLSDIVFRGGRYRTVFGNGVFFVRDADAGKIDDIRVDSELAGQTLYVQVSNASGMTEEAVEINENGYATVNLSTVSGENIFYLTTQAYAFPPTGDGEHGELDGVYVNPRTNENGLFVYDSIRLTNGVHAVIRYRLDLDLYEEIASEIPMEELFARRGKGMRYVALEDPQRPPPEHLQSLYYMKMDGYPYGTQEKPTYVATGYPNPDCQVYYIIIPYDLN